jgi:hypothetical protein
VQPCPALGWATGGTVGCLPFTNDVKLSKALKET